MIPERRRVAMENLEKVMDEASCSCWIQKSDVYEDAMTLRKGLK